MVQGRRERDEGWAGAGGRKTGKKGEGRDRWEGGRTDGEGGRKEQADGRRGKGGIKTRRVEDDGRERKDFH